MMTDAELKRCLNDYECESLPQMLREVAANSKHCTSEAGGRIPTWPLHEAAERLEAIAALPPQVSPDLIEKLGKLANYLTEQGEYEACDLIDTVVERVTKPARAPQGDGLAELRALSDVSSQGEWVLNTFNFKPEIKAGGNVIGFLRTHPDAAFIVACVNYVRRVLAGDAP